MNNAIAYFRRMNVTIFIIAFTATISFLAFNNGKLLDNLLLWPAKMKNNPAEYYRLLTAGFVHADITHLAFNMITLYFFGAILQGSKSGIGVPYFTLLYFTAIIISCIPSTIKQANNPAYRSLGASGGVAAIVFGMIYIYPWEKIFIFFIPIGIPCIVYALFYLAYTFYMARKGRGYVNHDAHLWGSLYGIVFMIIIDPTHGRFFFGQIMHPQF